MDHLKLPRLLLFALLSATLAFAQNGDKPGEDQPPPPPTLKIPPAPPLSPAEALRSFKLQPGFRIQLVASEPMVQSPVAIAFDPDGRIWVLEMRGFMPNVDGIGEDKPLGRISVLEDTDGDGAMDKSHVFLDGLVMPRAMALVKGGLLVAEPPNLFFCKDTDGDGKCDEKTVVATDYGSQANPEHTSNSLTLALDNWIYSANHTSRLREFDGEWRKETTVFRGQWGLTQDNFGRLFYNSNSDQLRYDLVPSAYLARNWNLRSPSGLNIQTAKDQAVWPIRVNPGVNRGYQKGQLRADGTLATYTGACGPCIYRGDNFPEEFQGSAFLCEPTGNLVRCNRLAESEGTITATNAFLQSEFLASTDERFRPVNLFNGPDGALYVVDIYRGVLQHRIYLTSYLRKQSLSRGLDKPTDLGRIYRVVNEARPLTKAPALSKARSEELVKALASPKGWVRDTAQRLLTERGDPKAAPLLAQMASSGGNDLAQLHGLWTLEGLRQLEEKTILSALSASNPKVQASAIRLAEPFLKTGKSPELLAKVLSLQSSRHFDVRLQLALSLGELRDAESERALLKLLREEGANPYVRDAVISGLSGRELDFLGKIAKETSGNGNAQGETAVMATLAKCVATEAKSDRVAELLQIAASIPPGGEFRQAAILDGIVSTVPPAPKGKPDQKPKPLRLAKAPGGFEALQKGANPALRSRLERLDSFLVWPGKPGVAPEAEVKPLSAAQKERFEAGKELYVVTCGACHQPHGLGQEGLAPPLVDSDWATGSEKRITRIVLQGVRGPINVKGRVYEMEMPQLGILEDEQISQLLTYVRREWGHTASPIDPDFVAKTRMETSKREEAWTEKELLAIP